MSSPRVIVARAQMDVMPQPSALAADDQDHLGVGFVPYYAVDHMGAGFLQPVGQSDIGRLVKAGPQLDHHGDLFTRARRVDQVFHHRRIRTGSVEGLFDGQHIRVLCRLTEQLDDRGEGFERVMEQHIMLAHDLEQITPVAELGRQTRREPRVFELRAVDDVADRQQAVEVDRTVDLVEVVGLEPEFLEQKIGHVIRAVGGDLEADRIAVAA